MPSDETDEAVKELAEFLHGELMHGMVSMTDHDGLLNATKAIMVGVASGGIPDRRGATLISGVKTALQILEAKRRVHGPQNPLQVGPEVVTPDGPFGFKQAK